MNRFGMEHIWRRSTRCCLGCNGEHGLRRRLEQQRQLGLRSGSPALLFHRIGGPPDVAQSVNVGLGVRTSRAGRLRGRSPGLDIAHHRKRYASGRAQGLHFAHRHSVGSSAGRDVAWRRCPPYAPMGEGANLAMLDGAELANAITESPDDVEAALARYEAPMFTRSTSSAADLHAIMDLCLNASAPNGLIAFFKGAVVD